MRAEPLALGLAGLQVLGLACLLAAAWAIYDGWHALAVFGLALLALVEFIRRGLGGRRE